MERHSAALERGSKAHQVELQRLQNEGDTLALYVLAELVLEAWAFTRRAWLSSRVHSRLDLHTLGRASASVSGHARGWEMWELLFQSDSKETTSCERGSV